MKHQQIKRYIATCTNNTSAHANVRRTTIWYTKYTSVLVLCLIIISLTCMQSVTNENAFYAIHIGDRLTTHGDHDPDTDNYNSI
ncbi:MAG: hypothetical protein GFH27_549283n119 [Chloroflexi bacterium AL-W]|nr:hypothetical protein [Chloroflexi bacterium AL-N1]NOK64760.1 hypothetical protein [Chloroflexi bacterium AL-N10]NOK76001.1 hypothetical protein [Chloroflexi bacterium AL-N5]NOK80240.1 hypothetical protein [Chloroflexi bacterium AL-W]NOK86753.1 hypothetical protein [Chloroflexi bacterium AL-N15]